LNWQKKILCLLSVGNFTKILQATFCTYFLVPKNYKSQTVIREKLCNTLWYEKAYCKMLVKLTPGFQQQFWHIAQGRYLQLLSC